MDFSKSIYWRGGVPAVRARSLAPASLRLIHDTLAITHHSLPFAPVLRCAYPSVCARLPHPGCAPLRPASPAHPSRDSSARRSRSGYIVPHSVYPLRVRAALPLARTSSRARRVTREGSGSTPCGGGWAGRTNPRGCGGVAACVNAGLA